jgi:NADH-quinone oxidoreductase subunit M
VLAALGLIVGAIYSLILMQRSFQGELNSKLKGHSLTDFASREMLTMAVMMVALIGLGLYPQPVLDMAQPVVDSLLNLTSVEIVP